MPTQEVCGPSTPLSLRLALPSTSPKFTTVSEGHTDLTFAHVSGFLALLSYSLSLHIEQMRFFSSLNFAGLGLPEVSWPPHKLFPY